MIRLGQVRYRSVLSDITVVNDELRVRNILSWLDPEDVKLYSDDSGYATDVAYIALWAGTKVVRKEGSAPTSINDGVLICDSKNKDAYRGCVTRFGSASVQFSITGNKETIYADPSITDCQDLDLPKGAMSYPLTPNGSSFTTYSNSTSYLSMTNSNSYIYPTASSGAAIITTGEYAGLRPWYYYSYFIDDDPSLEFDKTYYYAFFPYTTDGAITDVRNSNPVYTSIEYPSWQTGSNKVVYRALQLTNDGYIDTYEDLGWRVGDTRNDRYTLVHYRPKTRLVQDIKMKGGSVTNYANWAVWDRVGDHWANTASSSSYNSYGTYRRAMMFPADNALGGTYSSSQAYWATLWSYSQYNYSRYSYYTYSAWNSVFNCSGIAGPYKYSSNYIYSSWYINNPYIEGLMGYSMNYAYKSQFIAAITLPLKNDYIMIKGSYSYPTSDLKSSNGYNWSAAWLEFNGIKYMKRSFIKYLSTTSSTNYRTNNGRFEVKRDPRFNSYITESNDSKTYLFSTVNLAGAYGLMSPFEVNGSFYDAGVGNANDIEYINGMTAEEKNNAFSSEAQFDYFKTAVNKPRKTSGLFANVYQIGLSFAYSAWYSSYFVPQPTYDSSYLTNSYNVSYILNRFNSSYWKAFQPSSDTNQAGYFYALI